jgi:glycosyltransferase involved in cell wall biosynthesis
MRICLFTPNFLPNVGGAERMADTLARHLTDRGHDLIVLAQKAPGPEPDLGYPVFRYRRPPAQHLWPEVLAWSLARAHRAHRFDLVLSFYAYPTGYAATRVKRRLGVKVIINTRGGDLYPNFHGLNKPRVARTIASGYQHADRIITLSDWLTRRLHEVAGHPLPPVDQIANGIDLAEHDRQCAAAREHRPAFATELDLADKRFILHLGRVAPVKQHEHAIDAVGQLRDWFQANGMRYLIVGQGNAFNTIRQRIEREQLGHIIHMLGTRTGLDKYWLLDHAALLVSSSREEGMPNVLLEAMASGLPALVSDIGPHRELLADRDWGRMFPDGDVEQLALKLRDMLESDLTPFREAALALREAYSLKRMVDRYETACLQTLAD